MAIKQTSVNQGSGSVEKKIGKKQLKSTGHYLPAGATVKESTHKKRDDVDETLPHGEIEEESEDVREKVMSLGDHLEELRKRVLIIVFALLVATLATFVFIKPAMSILIQPYQDVTQSEIFPHGARLLLGNVYGSIEVAFQLAFIIGVLVTLPLTLFVLWGYVTPAVSRKAAAYGHIVVAASSILFYGGMIFCWYFIYPVSLKFMLTNDLSGGFLPASISPEVTVERYFSFFFALHLGSGLLFQLPLLIIVLGAIGILTISWHKKLWRYIILGIFVLAAIITPPEPVSQCLFAFPLAILYGISVLIVWLIEKARGKESNEEKADG